MMNLPAVNETMKSLRAELLAIKSSRSAAAAMLKVAAKSDATALTAPAKLVGISAQLS